MSDEREAEIIRELARELGVPDEEIRRRVEVGAIRDLATWSTEAIDNYVDACRWSAPDAEHRAIHFAVGKGGDQ